VTSTQVTHEVVDFAALTRWMDDQKIGQGPVEDITSLQGGTQNLLFRFRRGQRAFVLRRPPEHPRANSNDTMRREARVLAALLDTGVPHPKLIAACSSEDVLGAAFYLMEPVDGFNATVGLPALHASDPAIRRRMGLSLIEGIAALGRIDHVKVGLSGLGRPENFLARQVERWRSQFETYRQFDGWPGGDDLPGLREVGEWLEDRRPQRFEPSIIHGDYHLANVMFRYDAPELAAIVDWELVTIGDPLVDLGWVLATWPDPSGPVPGTVGVKPWSGFPAAGELIEHYSLHSGRDVSGIAWYKVLACYKLGIVNEGTYARACAGQASMETGKYLHQFAIGLFERAGRWIGEV
jgi:aminoglycoside phosphotransferase (APT) family kinase protein